MEHDKGGQARHMQMLRGAQTGSERRKVAQIISYNRMLSNTGSERNFNYLRSYRLAYQVFY
jgi:hypothetical protein